MLRDMSPIVKSESCDAKNKHERCRNCGSSEYTVYHQLGPYECWWVGCDECGIETDEFDSREAALGKWRGGKKK